VAFLLKVAGADVVEGARRANPGQFFVYGVPVAPGARCTLTLQLETKAPYTVPGITVSDQNGKPVPARIERAENSLQISFTAPAQWELGARLPVVISAKNGPFAILNARFVQQEPDANQDGLPDSVAAQMRLGLPPATPITILRPPANPVTVTQTPRPPSPEIDLQTDAVFAYTTDANVIAGWKQRGYTVWTMGGSRDGKAYAEKHPDECQTQADGTQLTVEGSYYLAPTPNRIAIEKEFYRAALANGSEGICPEEPEYWARAGFEEAFKQAWQKQYGAPWQPPNRDVETRWKAGQLKALMQANHLAELLNDAAQRKPNARRMVALHSPLNYAWWRIIAPHHRITSLSNVQDVIGQVWTGTARTPARHDGLREDHTFSVAYLEYSSLYHLLRGTNKRLWFLMDPIEDDLTRTQEDYESHYYQTLAAALLFPDVTSYEVMPWPERVYGRISAPYATIVNSVIAALQEMPLQQGARGNAVEQNDIGIFYSDSMQWQREEPNPSDFDGVFGLTLPLLQRGVPVQMISLDRAADPNYLRAFKTLLLSYDFQKPMNPRAHRALADWVRGGGSLIFFGGSDAYNAVADSWWRKANLSTPQSDLWKQLGLTLMDAPQTRLPEGESGLRYTPLQTGDGAERNLKNRRLYTLDLTRFVAKTGSVAVRFSDVSPEDGWGAYVASVELRVNGQVVAAFRAGSEIENRFLVYDNQSQYNGTARFADGRQSWTYQFDNLPKDQSVELRVDMGNGFRVEAAEAQAEYGHTLLAGPQGGALGKAFPRLRVGSTYSVTSYPSVEAPKRENSSTPRPMSGSGETDILFTLRAGGAPVWAREVGKGLLVYAGVAPGFFSSSERSAALLRGLTQYAYQRAGGVYREPGFLRVKRGRYTVVRTFGKSVTLEGQTLDLLSPTLSITNNRVVPPRSLAVVREVEDSRAPGIAFVSGRVQAKLETQTATAYFSRGPLNTSGVARILSHGKRLAGARAADRLGRTVFLQAEVQGDTVFVRYPNHPDGIVVRLIWQ
jgi:hypothetical protein